MTPLLITLLLEAAAGAAPPLDLDGLLQALRQPPSASTAFVEQRESSLLAEPLQVRGRLARYDDGTLLREVQFPYRESTTISEQRVEVVREGERPRRFALRNAPGLEALLASFRGVLSGDRSLLERHYRLALQGDAAGWQLRLTPRDPRLARRIAEVRLSGRGGELRCIEVVEAAGGSSRMLLGDAAAASEPGFDAECRGG